MPLPPDDKLDEAIEQMFDGVMDRANEPGHFGVVMAKSARLQAASQHRLTIAMEKAAEAQDRMNDRIERLEKVGIRIGWVGLLLALVQIAIAILELAVK